jgi:hypothetical protein
MTRPEAPDFLSPIRIVSRQWDESGEHCVDWTEEPIPSRTVGVARLSEIHSLEGLVFHVERDDGLRLRVSEAGMSRGLCQSLSGVQRHRFAELPMAQFLKAVKALDENGYLCDRIIDTYHDGNPFGAVVLQRGKPSYASRGVKHLEQVASAKRLDLFADGVA